MRSRRTTQRVMYPSPIPIPWLGGSLAVRDAMVGLSVVVSAAIVLVWGRRREGLGVARFAAAIGIIVVSGFAAGRAHFVLNQWARFDDPVSALRPIWQSIHAGGVMFGVVASTLFVGRFLGLPLGRLADSFVPGGGIGIVIARLGCFAHGCCGGTVCFHPWCFAWPKDSLVYRQHLAVGLSEHAPWSMPVHPLQLYFAGVGAVLTAFAIWYYPRRRFPGEVALLGLALFAATSFGLEFLRANYPGRSYWGDFPQLAWAALALFVVAAVGLTASAAATRRSHLQRALDGAV